MSVRSTFVVLSLSGGLFAALPFCLSDALGQSVVPRITVSGSSFVVSGSGRTFTPWGFNYDRDWEYQLIEDYWRDEWDKVEEDFGELQALGS
jgi:hypothetical protein